MNSGRRQTDHKQDDSYAGRISNGGVRIGRVELRRCPGAAQRGFTLVEVLLVLVLLVVIGAITLPVLTGTIARSKLRNGSDVVIAAWSTARLTAMETGEPYLFRCQLAGAQFQFGSLGEYVTAGGATATPDNIIDDSEYTRRLSLDRLPGGVTFVSGEFAPSQHLAAMIAEGGGSDWSKPIVFQPDGTSTDASLLLANENQQTLRIILRGVTGTARVGQIGEEAVPQ